jgi:uncharacterized protein YndB with AHSA1/START domain
MYASLNAARDQSCALQHAQMLSHRDPRHGERRGELRHHGGSGRETLEQRPARAVGKRVKNRIESIISTLAGTFTNGHALIMKPNGDIFKCYIPLCGIDMNLRPVTAVPTISRRQAVTAGAAILTCATARLAPAAENGDRVSRTAEALHQEPVFHASRHRIYGALTDPKEFDRVMAHSDALKSMAVDARSAVLDARPGGAFSLFGGYINGRFLELSPDLLIVQAWRSGSWAPGVYSIAHFDLREDGTGSRIVFDHTGFPVGQADHLAAGWYANYWNPLREVLT